MHYRAQRLLDNLPWRISQFARRFFPTEMGYCRVISKNPIILFIPEDFYEEAIDWNSFFEAFPPRPIYFVLYIRSAVEAQPEKYSTKIANLIGAHRRQYPNHYFVFLANNLRQLELFKTIGLTSIYCSHNALADERHFDIWRPVEKRYDAIYNAVVQPYKRHELSVSVPRLALTMSSEQRGNAYFDGFADRLKDAAWLNFDSLKPLKESHFKFISRAELGKLLCAAKVGLCLSAQEGAMFASIEYLLCGIPIVSTRSIGGRDVFFDPKFSSVVDDSPNAVRDGVEEMIGRNLDARHIRETTLRNIAEHRKRFVEMIGEIHRIQNVYVDVGELGKQLFPSTFVKLRAFHEVLAEVK